MAEAAAVRTAVGAMSVRTVFTVRAVGTMTGTAAGAMPRAAVSVAAVGAFALGAAEFGTHHHSHLAGRLHEALEKSFVDCFIRIHHIHSHSFFLIIHSSVLSIIQSSFFDALVHSSFRIAQFIFQFAMLVSSGSLIDQHSMGICCDRLFVRLYFEMFVVSAVWQTVCYLVRYRN
jgi:hypothetical protein